MAKLAVLISTAPELFDPRQNTNAAAIADFFIFYSSLDLVVMTCLHPGIFAS
jgi:hypothetical protein